MWQFPALETKGTDTRAALTGHLREKFGVLSKGNLTQLATARHTVTFRNIRLEPYLVRVARLPHVMGARVVALGQIRRIPISNATQKIAWAAIAHGGKAGLEAQEEF
jgi:hypothetical protein